MRLPSLLLLLAGLSLAAPVPAASARPPATPPDPDVRAIVYKAGPGEDNVHPGDVLLPFVTLPDPAVSARINDRIFIERFRTPAPRRPVARMTAADGIVLDAKVSEKFSVTRHDARVLSLAFDGEGCGAYCESYRQFLGFDLATGRWISPKDVITPAGMRALSAMMAREKVARFRREVVTLQRALAKERAKKGGGKADRVEELDSKIAFNRQCAGDDMNADDDTAAATPAPERTKPEPIHAGDNPSEPPPDVYDAFDFAQDAFRLTAGRCSNHVEHALDDVTLVVPYAALRPHLSAYGRALLFGEGSAPAPAGIDRQVLHGRIGGKAPAKDATLTLTAQGERLSGQWTGDRTLDVELAP